MQRRHRLDTIEYWWIWFNEDFFCGKLKPIRIGLTRSRHTDGYYEYYTDPRRRRSIMISERLFDDEDNLRGTILHEMIHQYQHEHMSIKSSGHDAYFQSIARQAEKRYRIKVR